MSAAHTCVPSRAFDALDLPLIMKLAKLAGIDRPRIESSTFKIPSKQPALKLSGDRPQQATRRCMRFGSLLSSTIKLSITQRVVHHD